MDRDTFGWEMVIGLMLGQILGLLLSNIALGLSVGVLIGMWGSVGLSQLRSRTSR